MLLGYNIYRDDAYLTSVGVNRNSLTDVVGVEGSYDYSISSVVELYGESDLVGPLTVEIVAPGPVMHAPRDLVVTSNGLAAQLDWNPPAGGDQWFGYNNDQKETLLEAQVVFQLNLVFVYLQKILLMFKVKC